MYEAFLALLVVSAATGSRQSTAYCKIEKITTICNNVTLAENRPLKIENATYVLKLNPPLKEIPPRTFVLLPKLKVLAINFTLMETIYSSSFAGLNDLQELNLYWNQISEIPPGAFRDCSNLIYLNLGGNNMMDINGEVFAGLKHLRDLVLSSNRLAAAPKLTGLENLESLDLSKNRIKKLHQNAFDGLPSLTNLNLKGNEMLFIQSNAFHGLGKLKYLNLDWNNLDSLDDVKLRENLPSLLEIRLNVNDFSCEDLEIIIENFLEAKISVPEGLAEPDQISRHGMFCLPRNVIQTKKFM